MQAPLTLLHIVFSSGMCLEMNVVCFHQFNYNVCKSLFNLTVVLCSSGNLMRTCISWWYFNLKDLSLYFHKCTWISIYTFCVSEVPWRLQGQIMVILTNFAGNKLFMFQKKRICIYTFYCPACGALNLSFFFCLICKLSI